jgi:hypothetical protein
MVFMSILLVPEQWPIWFILTNKKEMTMRKLFLSILGLFLLVTFSGVWAGPQITGGGSGSSSGDISTDTIWDAAGDMVQGTGANTAGRTAIGTAGQSWMVNAGATAGEWGLPIPLAAGAGTVDAITANYAPDVSLTDKRIVAVRSAGVNTSTTPSFAPDGLTARTIVKQGGQALVAGDIGAAGFIALLQYDLSNTRWELLNPVYPPTPTTFTVADEAADTSSYILFVTAALGSLSPKTNAALQFNSATGTFTLGGTLALGANNITGTGSIGATGAGKWLKFWGIDAEFTNLPTINGGTLVAALHLDDVRTALGIAAEAVNMGNYTGSTIPDAQTQVQVNQALETAVETKVSSASTASYTEPGTNLPICRTGAGTLGGCTNLTDLAFSSYAPLANPVFTGVVDIPTDATTDAAGEITIDLTTDQFRFYGGAVKVLPSVQYQSFVIPAPAATDDILIMKAPYGMTITAVSCIVQGTTSVTGQLQECTSAGASCADTDADIVCDADGAADDGAFTNGSIDAADWIMWKTTSVDGTPTFLTVTFTYTVVAD